MKDTNPNTCIHIQTLAQIQHRDTDYVWELCLESVLKCSGSRMAHLILLERKECKSNEKKGGWRHSGAACDGAEAAKAGAESRILVTAVQNQKDDGEQKQ